MKNRKTIYSIMILIISLAVVSGCAKKLPAGNQNINAIPTPGLSPSPLPQETPEIDTSNWKTYRNEEYGFEVRYPGEWYNVWNSTFSSEDIDAPLEVSLKGILVEVKEITIDKKDKGNFYIYVENVKKDKKIVDEKNLEINDYSATQLILGPEGVYNNGTISKPSGYYINTYLNNKNDIYLISGWVYFLDTYQKNKEIYDDILRNFKIIK